MPYQLVDLSKNINLPQYIYEKMLALREKIINSITVRSEAITKLGMDEKFCIGDSNWIADGSADFLHASRHVQTGDYKILNTLRFWSQCFTGYKIMRLEIGAGTHSLEPVPDPYDEWLAEHRSTPDGWCSHWRTLMNHEPKHVFSPPRMLGEVGWDMDGVVVSHDTVAYQERLSLMEMAGIFDRLAQLGRPARILEIGGGYGALARAIHAHFPQSQYVICDLPESLIFSGLYIAGTSGLVPDLYDGTNDFNPSAPFTLVPNYLFALCDCSSVKFDLVINTLSMSEMSEHQVRRYCRGISHMIGNQGVFFEQNQDNTVVGMIFAKNYIQEFFKNRASINPPFPVVHGAADLWSNSPLS